MTAMGWRLVHLLVLATLAITQPLLSILGANPTFFTAHSAAPGQVIAFTAIVSLAPATALGAVMLAGHAISARTGESVFSASLTVLTFLFVIQVVDVLPGPAPVVAAVAAAASYGLMVLYWTQHRVRSAVSVLAVFPVAVVLVFLFHSPVSSIAFPDTVQAVNLDDLVEADFAAEHPTPGTTETARSAPERVEGGIADVDAATRGSRATVSAGPQRPASMAERLNDRFPPIFLLVFDELPWFSLLDEQGRIDAVRYPNFARLGATSHVFSDATTVALATEHAIPALVASTRRIHPAPVFSMYPNNLFTLFGGVYDTSSSDPMVDLCPPSVCNGTAPEAILELVAADDPASPTTSSTDNTTATTATVRPAADDTVSTSSTISTSSAASTSSTVSTSSTISTSSTASTSSTVSTGPLEVSTVPHAAPAFEPATASVRRGSLWRLLEDAAIVFAHLAASENLDPGLPPINAGWGDFWREAALPSTETDEARPARPAPAATVATGTDPTAAEPAAAHGDQTTTSTTTAPPATGSAATATGSRPEPEVTSALPALSISTSATPDPTGALNAAGRRWAFIDDLLANDTRVANFRAEVAEMETEHLPRLHYLHALLPHVPWRYRPDGTTYPDTVLLGYASRWTGDLTAARYGQQRHLLQLGFVDRLLGEYLDRLEEIGEFDRAIVIVTADHGVSFVPGEAARGFGDAYAGGSASVPLIYKEPGQKEGTIQPQPVQLIDIVPTIAGHLGVEPPWEFDGRDLFTAAPARDRSVAGLDGTVPLPDDFAAVVEALAADMHETFGDGTSGSLYALGGEHHLIGRPAREHATGPSAHCWTIERPLATPDADGAIGYVHGRIDATAGDPIDFAISVDGVVAGTARSFSDGSSHRVYAIGDARFWRDGDPSIEIHEIVDGRLAPIPYC